MCFKDDWARATLLWDAPSIEFVKAYAFVVCLEFEAPDDLKWWRKQKSLLLKFGNRELSATGEFMASESAAVLTAADWIYREAKDIGYAAAVGAYSEVSGFKEALDSTCDGLKAKGLSISSGVIDEVVSVGDAALAVYSGVKTMGSHVASHIGNETAEGIREGILELSLANRTRGTFSGLTRFADSVRTQRYWSQGSHRPVFSCLHLQMLA
jgi:hypothetical protein